MRTKDNFYILMFGITILLFIIIFLVYYSDADKKPVIVIEDNYIIEKLDKNLIEIDIKARKKIVIDIKKGLKVGTKIIINNKTDIEHIANIEDEKRNNIPIKKNKSLIFIRNNVWEMGYRQIK